MAQRLKPLLALAEDTLISQHPRGSTCQCGTSVLGDLILSSGLCGYCMKVVPRIHGGTTPARLYIYIHTYTHTYIMSVTHGDIPYEYDCILSGHV